MGKYRFVFLVIWFLLLLLGPITVLLVTPVAIAKSSPALTINFFQRLLGLVAFTLIFIQILLGAWMPRLIDKLGAWVFKFHTTQGAFIYALVFLHPLLFVLFNYQIKGVFDPFYVFTDLCVLCKDNNEYYYNFGRIGFWLVTVAVATAILRTRPWLQVHWHKFHILNYLAFYAIWFHSLKVGTDVGTFPFSLLHGPSLIIVSGTLVYKMFAYLRSRT